MTTVNSPSHRRRYIREVAVVYRRSRIPNWLDTDRSVQLARDARPYFTPLERRVRETLMALYLNAKHVPIAREVVHVGAIRSCFFSPGEIIRSALLTGASAVIVAHNHPSEDVRPSPEDEQAFDELKKAAALVDIQVLDSLIIAPGNYSSVADARLWKQAREWADRRDARRRAAGARPQERSG